MGPAPRTNLLFNRGDYTVVDVVSPIDGSIIPACNLNPAKQVPQDLQPAPGPALGAGRHLHATNSSYVKNQNITLGPSLGQPLDILNPRLRRLALQRRF